MEREQQCTDGERTPAMTMYLSDPLVRRGESDPVDFVDLLHQNQP